jgi:ketosteroid isomerase-like protein
VDADGNEAIARRYLAALSARADPDAVAAFFTADAILVALPNRLVPGGASRDVAGMREARARGLALLSAERYDVVGCVSQDRRVAMEVIWSGTARAAAGPFRAGQELRAHFAIFLEFRDGRIASQRNYDCFEEWGGPTTG